MRWQPPDRAAGFPVEIVFRHEDAKHVLGARGASGEPRTNAGVYAAGKAQHQPALAKFGAELRPQLLDDARGFRLGIDF